MRFDEIIRATIDRIEGDWLVLVPESGQVFQIPSSLFPGFKEGDIVSISLTRDEQSEKEAKERIGEIRKGLNRVEL
jgi:hypothetical protein